MRAYLPPTLLTARTQHAYPVVRTFRAGALCALVVLLAAAVACRTSSPPATAEAAAAAKAVPGEATPVASVAASRSPAVIVAPAPTATSPPAATAVPSALATRVAAAAPTVRFVPGEVRLSSIGDSAEIAVVVSGVPPAADGFQAEIDHSDAFVVDSVACVGLFEGAFVAGPAAVEGGTLLGCAVAGGVDGTAGEMMRFVITRASAGDEVVTLGTEGRFGTRLVSEGVTITSTIANSLAVSSGAER